MQRENLGDSLKKTPNVIITILFISLLINAFFLGNIFSNGISFGSGTVGNYDDDYALDSQKGLDTGDGEGEPEVIKLSNDDNSKKASNILSIQNSDSPIGSGDILLVEYSDYECPFCQRFHSVPKQLVNEGEITWVYRHLPLAFHETALEGSVIAECVKTHRGSGSFWNYTDAVFNRGVVGINAYRALANELGLTNSQIDACLSTNSAQHQVVEKDISDAQFLGIHGTPGSYLVNSKSKEVINIPGALPVELVKELLAKVK